MKNTMEYEQARDLLLSVVSPMPAEPVLLEEAGGRVLAEEIRAREDVPPFDRSPYDGYALRSEDTGDAAESSPVTLRILEEIPAGGLSHFPVTKGCAVKVLTGAPIPEGADAVLMFEKTKFTAETVTVFGPVKSGSNIVRAGEDIPKGGLLASPGCRIDAGLAAAVGAQNIVRPLCFRIPRIGLISTGSELTEVGEELAPGKIYNTNRYSIQGALEASGVFVKYLGSESDSAAAIASRITEGLASCDMVVLTGGVSVGDYDRTPKAMEEAGVNILVRGVSMKPGMACCYGEKDGKLVIGLSGNPASSLTNYYACVMPAVRKLCGLADPVPPVFPVRVIEGFGKKSGCTRFLRGRLDLSDGTARMHISKDQGNVVISSAIGCDVMALVPAGTPFLPEGGSCQAFLLR